MSLRPRYSLLTLLILTALVAGGVKLWYGPHHVVEQSATNREIEYTFTRHWGGESIHGPYVKRFFETDKSSLQNALIRFYRHGVMQNWEYSFITHLDAATSSKRPVIFPEELSTQEQATWLMAIDQEKSKLAAQGGSPSGFWRKVYDPKREDYNDYVPRLIPKD